MGVAALVAINSFTDNLLESVRGQARALLGADLAVSSGAPFGPKVNEVLRQLERAAGPAGEVAVARVTSFAAMAYAPKSGGTRLVQVAAVEPGYPFYGRSRPNPRRRGTACTRAGSWPTPPCSPPSGPRWATPWSWARPGSP